MLPILQLPSQADQTNACLRGLLTIAWADGHFDAEEQQMISGFTAGAPNDPDFLTRLDPISPTDLASALGFDTKAAENFMRMGVMVALSDGVYSFCEDEILYQFCLALQLDAHILMALRSTLMQAKTSEPEQLNYSLDSGVSYPLQASLSGEHHEALLNPVREWLDHLEVHDPKLARFLCKVIPPQCPFERDIHLFGHKVAHIPPLCKINPLYEQLVGLRFRALSYLADDCGEDISAYC